MIISVDFIIDQLKPIYPSIISGGSIRICCPFHDESTPSCYINLDEDKVPLGIWSCFGCESSGNWNKLAAQLGLEQVDFKQQAYDKQFTSMYRRLKKIGATNSYKLPENLSIWEDNWRNFTSTQLAEYQPAKFYDLECEEYRILFPIIQSQKLMGHLSERLTNKDKGPKHKFSKNFPSQQCLYPLDLHVGKTVILVEGLVDMLRLRSESLPALCFFGCGNWKNSKMNLLMSKGIDHVIICGDGDSAGHEINQRIKKDLEQFIDVNVFKIPIFEKKIDPGDMPEPFIRSLKALI
jgi:DNA primase